MSATLVTQDTLAESMHAAGIDGYVIESGGEFYIPVIIARERGKGHVSRWLDSLPRDVTLKVPGVVSAQLAGMLERRDFRVIAEWSPQHEAWVDVHVRMPA